MGWDETVNVVYLVKTRVIRVRGCLKMGGVGSGRVCGCSRFFPSFMFPADVSPLGSAAVTGAPQYRCGAT
ncbi:unnamed protein product [Mesocestoides corti]|uniref:Uncharacterized protein n=1 Tax=Mesocestoides corti TaxID=53468 RepID=A0A0R3UFI6_MESCO|nr:unnamed protein product [Mesocestoides corti]